MRPCIKRVSHAINKYVTKGSGKGWADTKLINKPAMIAHIYIFFAFSCNPQLARTKRSKSADPCITDNRLKTAIWSTETITNIGIESKISIFRTTVPVSG